MVEGVNSNMIHCRNFYKCHNVSHPSTTIKNILKNKEKKAKDSVGIYIYIHTQTTEMATV
jgi:hypothetical protein